MQHLSSLLNCQFLRSFDGGGEDVVFDSWALFRKRNLDASAAYDVG